MKLMIVDDEEYTREGIRDSFEWSKLGIQEIMLAQNGKEALTIAKWFIPDIILTDIKMPQKDGIEFTEEIVSRFPNCRILFMSGYVEVEYFKSALKLDVIDYIEKPIDKDRLWKAMEKAVDFIQKNRKIEEIKIDNQEMKKVRLLQALISTEPDENWLLHACEEVGFPEKGNFVCFIIKQYKASKSREEVKTELVSILQKYDISYLIDYLKGAGYVCVVQCKNIKKFSLTQMVNEILQDKELIAGLGLWVGNLKAISQSYRCAERVLEFYFFDTKTQMLELKEEMIQPKKLDPGIYNQFLAIQKEKPEELRCYLEKLLEEIGNSKQYRRDDIKSMFSSLLQVSIQERKGILSHLDGIYQAEDMEKRIQYMDTFDELRLFVRKFLDAYEKEIEGKNGYSWIVQKIMEYVAQHIENPDLSVQEIADYVSLSPTYISILFKKEVRVNLKQYISNIRMEKAKKMLKSECYKITEIAEKCGYANANYFSRAFHKSEDMTPVEYREKADL